MASRGRNVSAPSWTSWKWNDEHRKYRRQLKDHRGRVLEEEFDEQPHVPRNPPVIDSYPQQSEGGLEVASENYGLGSAGTLGSSQDSTSQWMGMNPPTTYGPQSAYGYTPPNVSYNIQNYATPASQYGPQGFTAAQNPHSGFGSPYGSSNPHSGYHGQPGNLQRPHQALGRNISFSPFNPQLSARPTMQSGQPPQYLYASVYPTSPTPQYQSGTAQGPTWQTEYRKHYEGNSGQVESHGSQHHDRVMAEQSSPPGFEEQDSTPADSVAPSGLPMKSSEALEDLNYETPSISAQDETSSSLRAIVGERRQSLYRGHHGATFDSSTVEPKVKSESENADAYEDNPDGDEKMEVATSYRKASQKPKVYRSKDRPSERKEGSRSRSRPPLSGVQNPGSYSEEPFIEVARGTGVDQQSDSTPSLHQESKELRKSSTRIPPKGFDRPDPYDEATTHKKARSGTKSKSPLGFDQRPNFQQGDMMADYTQEYDEDQEKSRGTGFEMPSFDLPHPSPSDQQQNEERQKPYHQSQEQQSKSNTKLKSEFRIHKSKAFTKGRVLKLLWSEPVGGGEGGATYEAEIGSTEHSKFGENAYHSVRRFVIVKEREGHSLCVPILTYRGQGMAKIGAKAHDHAIIYTGKHAPKGLTDEKKLFKKPIKVVNISAKEKLDEASRVNYSKVYTIEHNLKVCFIGEIDEDSRRIFFTDFKRTFEDDKSDGETKSSRPS